MADRISGPFLVADARQFRPRWSVILPAGLDFGATVPVLRAIGEGGGAEEQPQCPVPLAILLRKADPSNDHLSAPEANEQVPEAPPVQTPLTVVVEATDAARTEALARALHQSTVSGRLDLFVRPSDTDHQLRVALDELCGREAWTAVSSNADLRELAQASANELMLTVSDRVTLDDRDVLPKLCSMLLGDDTAASVSCKLLGERVIKNQTVLQPASAGLFPSHVSFASAPRLAFFEPDAAQALPDLTYPVVANTMLLTAWRRSALASLPRPSGPVPSGSSDLQIGLDLMEAGYRNLCTTGIRVALSGPYVPRDAIDPVGSTYARPDFWADLLGRVALLRELN